MSPANLYKDVGNRRSRGLAESNTVDGRTYFGYDVGIRCHPFSNVRIV